MGYIFYSTYIPRKLIIVIINFDFLAIIALCGVSTKLLLL